MGGSTERDYLLGTDDDELERLGFQHRVWAQETSALWNRAGFKPGQTILDLGCGPGYATLDLARLVGATGRIIGVDASARYLQHLETKRKSDGLNHVETHRCDVHELDLPAESFDGAYARWLFCFVKDPARVVSAVASALRPGGVFAVTDYFNYKAFTLAPRNAAVDRVVEAVQESWRAHDGDLDIMLKLPNVMAACGMRVTHVTPIVRAVKPGSAAWHWVRTFFDNYLPSMVRGGFITEAEREAFDSAWEKGAQDATTRLFTPPMLDVVAYKCQTQACSGVPR
ncbi:MAG: methyltransferase domain-containing protein [Phycisphaerae bacterium]